MKNQVAIGVNSTGHAYLVADNIRFNGDMFFIPNKAQQGVVPDSVGAHSVKAMS